MFVRAGHLALRVPDIDASVAHATQVMGMREVTRSEGTTYLSLGAEHHSLQLIAGEETAVDHMAFEVADGAALDALRGRLAQEGVDLLDEPIEEGIADAVRFVGPAGHVYEAYHGMAGDEPGFDPTGVRAKLFGHFTVTADDTAPVRDFAERVLGFRTSDVINTPGGGFVFMRCNALHHTLAVAPGRDGFHHYAWALRSLEELGELADSLEPHGINLVWGPGRHGPGDNIFTYHLDPAGVVVEHYADMEIVLDDAGRPIGEWPDAPRTMNLWGPLPAEDFIALSVPFLDRSRQGAAAA